MAYQLDLRTDLPKALAMRGELAIKVGRCDYRAPCVIGAMLPESARHEIEQGACPSNCNAIRDLIVNGIVEAPADQVEDFVRLQSAFDSGDARRFAAALYAAEQKYAVCDRCGATPIRDALDGDDLCQACCDQWARGERPDPVEAA